MKHLKNNLTSMLAILIALLSLSGCTKDNDKPTAYPIQGLWEGTFTEVSGFQDPPGSTFYFSFSIYPNGTFSYKSGTSAPGLFVYAAGTWTLNGTAFSFSGKTINGVAASQDNVAGTATFDTSDGTLNNGTVTSNTAGTTASWKMTRIK
jgi:hypothetical protein